VKAWDFIRGNDDALRWMGIATENFLILPMLAIFGHGFSQRPFSKSKFVKRSKKILGHRFSQRPFSVHLGA
jgi:hypothetical protein